MADPHWSNVSLLLHCDGSDGSTTFTDSSGTPKTVTAYGDAHIATDQAMFGGASAHFDGSGDYLSVPNSADWDFGSGNFTIELWFRTPSSVSSTKHLVGRWGTSGGLFVHLFLGSSNSIGCEWSTSGTYQPNNSILSAASAFSAGAWHHAALVRNGPTISLYLDGSSVATGAISGTIYSAPQALTIGSNTANQAFSGNIDDLRITKGVARYTANFTPPTTAFEHGDSVVSGTISATLASATGSLSGSVGVAGTLSATLAAMTGSISAQHVPPVTGTLSGTLSGLSGSLYGTHATPVTGTLSGTLANLTGSLSGSFGMNGAYGTLAGTLAGVSGSFSGAHLHPVTGTLVGHLANLTGSVHATTGESHRIRRGPWLRLRSEPNLVLLSCDDDDAGLNHSVVVAVGNINRPGDGSETGSVRVDLDNYDGRVSLLLAVPPLGVPVSLYGPTGDLWFDGTLASVNLSETAALQLEA